MDVLNNAIYKTSEDIKFYEFIIDQNPDEDNTELNEKLKNALIDYENLLTIKEQTPH